MNFILLHVERIILEYTGDMPLALFLKQFFKTHRRLGSRDRRSITEAVFTYYRCARFFRETPVLDIVFQGLHLCGTENEFLKTTFRKQGFNKVTAEGFSIENWVWKNHLREGFSHGIDAADWLSAMLTQPDLFIRIRQNKTAVKEKLAHAALDFNEIETNLLDDPDRSFYQQKATCVALKNGSKLDTALLPREYVVQDYASQCSMSVLGKYVNEEYSHQDSISVWDACSGAGGKSIYWKDKRPDDFLLATDIRRTILRNLKERFSCYDIQNFEVMKLDITSKEKVWREMKNRAFDVIFCDVPCSGSGTWSRTPEQFFFFEPTSLTGFHERQYKIALEASRFLKSGGLFAYITCSVFKKENEEVVQKLLQRTSLKLKHQQLINGINHRADSLFIAIFSKSG